MPDDSLPPHDPPARQAGPKARKGDPTPTPDHPEDDTSSYLAEESSQPSASSPLDDLPPELIDHPHFRVIRELGRGGMGVVYLAEHRVMKRLVALKLIHPSLLEKPGALQRYLREVKLAAELDHRNVVRALHAEQVGKAHLLVMEFVQGKNLSWILRKHGKLPVAHACCYARQAALGLQHAHEAANLVHRDVKPSNLMVTAKGLVKVLDFGLARQPGPQDRAITLADAGGRLVGTAHYVSPEQALAASSADARSDVYSLGCTLYHMLAGRPPFQGQSGETLISHLHQLALPLHEVRDDVPEELSAIVARMMAKDPNSRIQTAGEVAHLLLPFCRLPNQRPSAQEGESEVKASHTADPSTSGTEEKAGKRDRSRRLNKKSRLVAMLAAAGMALGVCLGLVVAFLLIGPQTTPDTPADNTPSAVEPVLAPPIAPATLILHLSPAGADVQLVAGETKGAKREGSRAELRLNPGEYAFDFHAEGHLPWGDTFVLRAGETQEWEITLAPEPPTKVVVPPSPPVELEIRGNLGGAEVSVEPKLDAKREKGNGSSWKYTFPQSAKGKEVEVKITLEGHKPFREKVVLGSRSVVQVAPLEKMPATAKPTFGTLRLRVNPGGAQLTIDGAKWAGEALAPDRWVEVSVAARKKVKVRLLKEGHEPREEEVEVEPNGRIDRRWVLLRVENKFTPMDHYAKGAKGGWDELRDASGNFIEPAEDMTVGGRELVGPGCWYIRPSVNKPFVRQGAGALLAIPSGYVGVEDCGVSRDGRWLFMRVVPPGTEVPDEAKHPWLGARGKAGLPFEQRRDLRPLRDQWNLKKGASLAPAVLSLPAKRMSPNELIIFPHIAGIRGVRANRTLSFKLEMSSGNLPAKMYPVAVGNNGSVVYSYESGNRHWLATSDCLPNDPGKVGSADGYTRPIHLIELMPNSKSLLARPTLSPDRRYVLWPELPPPQPPSVAKPPARPRTMIQRLRPEIRQRILEILDENP